MSSSTVAMPPTNYLNNGVTLKSWLLTKDHKRIALLYLAAVTFFFLIGAAFAVAKIVRELEDDGLVRYESHSEPSFRRGHYITAKGLEAAAAEIGAEGSPGGFEVRSAVREPIF